MTLQFTMLSKPAAGVQETNPIFTAYNAACVRLDNPNFIRILLTCVLTVFSPITSSLAISLFERPNASRRSTSVSRSVNFSGLSGALISRTKRAAACGESCTCPLAAALMARHSSSAWVSLSRYPIAPARTAPTTLSSSSTLVSAMTSTSGNSLRTF